MFYVSFRRGPKVFYVLELVRLAEGFYHNTAAQAGLEENSQMAGDLPGFLFFVLFFAFVFVGAKDFFFRDPTGSVSGRSLYVSPYLF